MKNYLLLWFVLFIVKISYGQSDSLTPARSSNGQMQLVNEEMPSFPGGEQALMRFVKENIDIPKAIKKEKLHGRIYTSFLIDSLGKVQNITIKKGFRKDIDDAAIKVVSSMPLWNPGRQNGRPVNVSFVLPVPY